MTKQELKENTIKIMANIDNILLSERNIIKIIRHNELNKNIEYWKKDYEEILKAVNAFDNVENWIPVSINTNDDYLKIESMNTNELKKHYKIKKEELTKLSENNLKLIELFNNYCIHLNHFSKVFHNK